jgi:hypothetical protein
VRLLTHEGPKDARPSYWTLARRLWRLRHLPIRVQVRGIDDEWRYVWKREPR